MTTNGNEPLPGVGEAPNTTSADLQNNITAWKSAMAAVEQAFENQKRAQGDLNDAETAYQSAIDAYNSAYQAVLDSYNGRIATLQYEQAAFMQAADPDGDGVPSNPSNPSE